MKKHPIPFSFMCDYFSFRIVISCFHLMAFLVYWFCRILNSRYLRITKEPLLEKQEIFQQKKILKTNYIRYSGDVLKSTKQYTRISRNSFPIFHF